MSQCKTRSDVKQDIINFAVKTLKPAGFMFDPQTNEFDAGQYDFGKNPRPFTAKIGEFNKLFNYHILKPISYRSGVYELVIPEFIIDKYVADYSGLPIVRYDRNHIITNSVRNQKLLNFIKKFNIEVEENDELLNSLPGKPKLAAFDTLQKFLLIGSGSEEAIPQQVANILYTFLGKKSKLGKELWFNIDKWSDYQKVYDKYANVKRNDEDDIEDSDYILREGFSTWAHQMTIIEFITRGLEQSKLTTPINKRENPDIDKYYFASKGHKNPYEGTELQKLWAKLYNWIQDHILNNPVFKELSQGEVNDLLNDLIDDVYKEDYSKFIRGIQEKDGKLYKPDGTELELKNYEKTLNNDPKANSIIKRLLEHPFLGYKLSGSQTLRKYGTIFRDILEDLHDIDGVIPLVTFQKEHNAQKFLFWLRHNHKTMERKQFKRGIESFINEQSWYQNVQQMFPTFKLLNAFVGKDHKNAESVTITGVVDGEFKNGKYVEGTGYILDFFLRTDEGNYPEIFDNYWKDWKQIFEAKMNMGRSKDISDMIYFAPFMKDTYKFTNKGFRFFSFMEERDTDETFDEGSLNTLNKDTHQESQDFNEHDEAAIKIIDKLSEQIPVNHQLITEDEAVTLTAMTKNPWTKDTGAAGFELGGVIYLIKGQFTAQTAFHEFSHPFIRSIAKTNPVLFESLYKRISETVTGKAIIENVKTFYNKDFDFESEEFKEECLVKSLTKNYWDTEHNLVQETGFTKILSDLLYAIKQLMRTVFGKKIKISELSSDTTISDLAKILREGGVIDINTELISRDDLVAYDRNQKLKEIEAFSEKKSEKLLKHSTKLYDDATLWIKTLKDNPNYEDVSYLLVDDFETGELQEMASSMRKFTEHIKNKLNKVEDMVAFRKAHAEEMINTLTRLNVIASKMREHINSMNVNDDAISNLNRAYYYDYFLRYWEDVTTSFSQDLKDSGFEQSEVRELLNNTNTIMTDARDTVKKLFQAEGVKDVIYTTVEPIKEQIDGYYTKIIETLRKEGASEKTIESYIKEYEGINTQERTRMELLKNKSSLTIQEKAELETLVRQSFKGAKITKEKISKMYDGQLGDTNMFSYFLEGYLSNPDVIGGGFALYLKNQLSEVMTSFQRDANNMINDLQPLLDEAGYTPAQTQDLINRICYVETLKSFDTDTLELKDKEVWRFLNQFKGYDGKRAELKHAIQEADRLFTEKGSDETYNNLLKAQAEYDQWNRDYMHQMYIPDFYKKDAILEKDDIGKKAKAKQQKIIDEIRLAQQPLVSQKDFLEIADFLKDKWREYRLLASIYQINGELKPKDSEDYQIAIRLKQYRESARQYYEWVEKPGRFLTNYHKYRQELIDSGAKDIDVEMQRWLDNNTRIKIKDQFFIDRKKIVDRITEISAKISANANINIKVGELYKELIDLGSGYRDDDNQIDGSEMDQGRLKRIKEVELEILKEKEKLTNISGFTKAMQARLDELLGIDEEDRTEEDEEQISAIFNKAKSNKNKDNIDPLLKIELHKKFAELDKLQKKICTEYYADTFNSWLKTMDLSYFKTHFGRIYIEPGDGNNYLRDDLIGSLTKQSPEFDKWFRANHYEVEIWNADKDGGSKETVWKRIYAWNATVPKDKKYYHTTELKDANGKVERVIQAVPNLTYFSHNVLPEFHTGYNKATGKIEKIVGVHITNKSQSDYLPRLDGIKDTYINSKYEELRKNDPESFKLLEKMKEWHLKNQEGLGKTYRLYLDVPRFRKTELEIMQSKQNKQTLKGVFEGKAPILTLIWDYVRLLWKKGEDSAEYRFSWQGKINITKVDAFDNELANIPIAGLYDLDLIEVSPDITQGMLRYMFSAKKNKKLMEITPVASAIQESLPDNISDGIEKQNLITRGLLHFTNNKELSIRKKLVTNLIEREFHGKVNADEFSDSTVANMLAKGVFNWSSFSFFALNIPSAMKNFFGAKFQSMIEASGGEHMGWKDYMRGEAWSTHMMGELSLSLYNQKNKTLSIQLLELFDPIQGRLVSKVPKYLSRTLTEDVAGLSWLYNFRKWTETQATAQMFAGLMSRETVTQNGNQISYLDAWEMVDGKIQLKQGIDPDYSPDKVDYTIVAGDTLAGIAAKFHITEEELTKRTKLTSDNITAGKVIRVGNSVKYNAVRNKAHMVINNLQGAYSDFDQPEAQRYLAFRFISFLRRYFTTMAMNRLGSNRFSPGMGMTTEGYYVTILKMAIKLFSQDPRWIAQMTPREKTAFIKFTVEVGAILAITMLILPLLGWDDDDPDRYEKMRMRSGALQIPGLTEPDPEHPFEMGGFLHNHMTILAMQVQAENGAFLPLPGPEFGLDDYLSLATPRSLAFGPTLETYVKMFTLGYYQATGDPSAYYKRDTGPYKWQQQGGSKFLTHMMRSMGLNGSTLDPAQATKNFVGIQVRGR